MAGWIRLERKLLEGDIGQDPNLLLIWVRLLMKAEWRDKQIKHGPNQVKLERGQIALSIRRVAVETLLNKNTVMRCLDYLEKTERIRTQRGTQGTIITICKYKDYQDLKKDEGHGEGQDLRHLRDTSGTRPKTRPKTPTYENNNENDDLNTPNNITINNLTNEQGTINALSCVEGDASEVPKRKPRTIAKPKIAYYTDDDKALADEWAKFSIEVCPTAKADPIKYAEAIAKTKKATDLNDVGMRKLFDFIRTDDFWRLNAYSPSGLLKKSANNGHRKVDNILTRMVRRNPKNEEQALREWAFKGSSSEKMGF